MVDALTILESVALTPNSNLNMCTCNQESKLNFRLFNKLSISSAYEKRDQTKLIINK